ncbi:GAF and ANTAR domain-containing protein [Nocardioides jensenii]|uniref:GAF and ANTAR domain-containing protein n=1 Tax=Nocardioides jensenii TaxID=1843 RepID=UPI000830BB7E|nr:GAF and ANTAR domain-containing protein [Nocardioides jensenii]
MRDEATADRSDTGPYFAELSQFLMSDHDVAATLERICTRSLEVVPAAAFCAITVRRRRGRLETLAHTDDTALRCDELQYELDEGPCIASALEDAPFLVLSTSDDQRWPRWGPKVADLGVHSLISVQLSAAALDPDRDPLGAINLYAKQVDTFTQEDLQRLIVYGVHAGNALANAHLVTTLGEAVERRHEIGVAQGIMLQRYGLDQDQAFETLQRYSSHANVKLRDVAALVIEQGGLPASYDDVGGEA